jgi:mannonate dehydratase
VSRSSGSGATDRGDTPWTLEEIQRIKSNVEAEGLTLHAIENLDPGHWHDVLLDGPKRGEQLEQALESIRLFGQADIPCLGYNFSLAGVWGHVTGPVRARRSGIDRF